MHEHRRLLLPLKVDNELISYLNERYETDKNLVPFQFWRRPDVRAKYPTLSLLAMDILCIPASSAESERVFSEAGFVLSPRRNKLNESTLQAMLCLDNWGKSGLITIGDHFGAKRGSEFANYDPYSNDFRASESEGYSSDDSIDERWRVQREANE